MYLALSIPGGFEWFIVLLPALLMISGRYWPSFIIPVRALKQLDRVTKERDDLMAWSIIPTP